MAVAAAGALVGGIDIDSILGARDTGSYAAYRLLLKTREQAFIAGALGWNRLAPVAGAASNIPDNFGSNSYQSAANTVELLGWHYARVTSRAAIALASSGNLQSSNLIWNVTRAGLQNAPTFANYVPSNDVGKSGIFERNAIQDSRRVIISDLLNLANTYRIKPNVMLSTAAGYLVAQIIQGRALREGSMVGGANGWAEVRDTGAGAVYNSQAATIATMTFGASPNLPDMEAGFSMGHMRDNVRKTQGGGMRGPYKKRRYKKRRRY
jgi:hypothetical protein